MATVTTTMAMDAMIESLKEASIMVQEITSKADTSRPGSPLPALKSMVLTPSTLCSACTSVLSCADQFALTIESVDQSEQTTSSFDSSDDILHHSLNDLSREATKGCHLCLVIYLGLDSEDLAKFASTLTKNAESVTSSPNLTTSSRKFSSSTLGYARITPIASDQARLSFRYIKGPLVVDIGPAQRQSLGLDFSVKSSIVSSFDFANFESQRASMGYWFESSNRNSGTSCMSNESETSQTTDDASLRVELTLVSPRRARQMGVRTIPSDSACTASDQCLRLARDWIRSCTENHLGCTVSSGAKWRPTYLLDVSIKDSKGMPGIKLVDGALLDRRSEYVTLSHAWGPAKPTRLHKGTAVALRHGVARYDLPRTLAEAAKITHKLGFKYLWIDALCIMHDDEQAVLDEISQMHKVYGNAALNIAAACAWGDSEGFIRHRNVTALQPCMVDMQGHGLDGGTYMVLKTTAWSDLVDKAPLHKRAWVLQERALAKRTLHFTKTELMWECQQTCCSETYPKCIPDGFRSSHSADTDLSKEPQFDKKLHHQQVGHWGHLVELYTTGKMSYQSDKLLGIAGLARHYLASNNLNESDYVVGLWKPELPQSLLWTVENGQRLPRYRAPTWSWASTDGAVKYAEPVPASSQTCLEVVEITQKHRLDDRFGLCQSAQLKVCGLLARGLLQRRRGYWGETSCSIQFPKARVRVDFHVASFDEDMPKSMLETLQVYVLPVTCTVNETGGLFLTLTERKGEFKRIGTFLLPTSNNHVNCERFRAAMNEDPGPTSYEEKLAHTEGRCWLAADHKYIITLV